MLKIGIECESIEDSQGWGMGREITKLLERLASRPELQNEFRFFLYFKSRIPNYSYLNSPLFTKKIVWAPFASFSLYYYIFLPIKLYFEGLNAIYFPNYMLPIIFRGRSLVSLTEDVYYEIKFGRLPARYRLAYRVFSNWAAKHATRIMCFTESSKQAVASLFKIPLEKIAVNYHGIDKPNTPAKSNTMLGNYIFNLGQAFPRRHLKETILAFEKIAPQFPDYKLITVGYDKYNPPIIGNLVAAVNQRLGKEIIIHKNYVSETELAELYTGAKLVTYISSQEAFGLPPVEALAYHVPPLVADSEVTREIFGVPPTNAAFFVNQPITVDSIAAALEKALSNSPARSKIIDSADSVLQKFNWPVHTDRFLDIIRHTAIL